MSAVSLKALENTQHLLRWFTICAICHQLGIAQNGIERRAQFVAHIGKKLRFVLASDFELSALVLDFAEQPCVLDCENRLISKRLQQFDCVLRKLAGLLSPHYQRSDNLIGA